MKCVVHDINSDFDYRHKLFSLYGLRNSLGLGLICVNCKLTWSSHSLVDCYLLFRLSVMYSVVSLVLYIPCVLFPPSGCSCSLISLPFYLIFSPPYLIVPLCIYCLSVCNPCQVIVFYQCCLSFIPVCTLKTCLCSELENSVKGFVPKSCLPVSALGSIIQPNRARDGDGTRSEVLGRDSPLPALSS